MRSPFCISLSFASLFVYAIVVQVVGTPEEPTTHFRCFHFSLFQAHPLPEPDTGYYVVQHNLCALYSFGVYLGDNHNRAETRFNTSLL